MLTIATADVGDLPVLLPMVRAYCAFYRVDPSDDGLRELALALIDNRAQGEQLIARNADGSAVGFNDLLDLADPLRRAGRRPQRSLCGFGRARHWCWVGIDPTVPGTMPSPWGCETGLGDAPDNTTARRLYDGIGAESSTWISYAIDA